MKLDFKMNPLSKLIKDRNLEEGGQVQKYIDSEVLRLSDPLIPLDTSILKGSGIRSTVIGSGEVKYSTPYAKRQYYTNAGSGRRGRLWFVRMKVDHLEQILKKAQERAK